MSCWLERFSDTRTPELLFRVKRGRLRLAVKQQFRIHLSRSAFADDARFPMDSFSGRGFRRQVAVGNWQRGGHQAADDPGHVREIQLFPLVARSMIIAVQRAR